MGIVITKQKIAPAKVKQEIDTVNVADLSIESLADRYGTLKDQVDAVKNNPVFAKFDQVSKELKERLSEVAPEDGVEITGEHWMLEIGSCIKKPRELKENAINKLITMLGMETFAQIAKVTIADCEKYLTPEQAAQIINSEVHYTENRKIVAMYMG